MTVDVKLYSMKEVAERNGENGTEVWIVIKDIVYNVTPYLEDHPGGGDLITEFAGKDATKGYYDFGHSSDANNILKKYKIGELVEEDRKSKKSKPKPQKPTDIQTAAAKAKAKEAEANAGVQKDRGFLSYATCGCLA